MTAGALPSQVLRVSDRSDIAVARRAARTMALAVGFADPDAEEIVLAVSELASNLAQHALRGTLTLHSLQSNGTAGIQVDSFDQGPGIPDPEQALTDGFSTGGSLGYGLGTVNRAMDELEIVSPVGPSGGTQIGCRRWLRPKAPGVARCPLVFGVATRAHPLMKVNGDAFVIKRGTESTLVAVIDGLGHGQSAHQAAEAARLYVEAHFNQPLADIFLGVGRTCRATRGVVMALARFSWDQRRLSFASVGNVETRVFGSPTPMNFVVRRGIVGVNAPDPVVTEHPWEPGYVMVLHSDGLATGWHWTDFPHLADQPAAVVAHSLLRALAKDDDDATVAVVRENR